MLAYKTANRRFDPLSIRIIPNFLLSAGIIALTVAIVIPILFILSGSFTDERSLVENGFRLIPSRFSTYAYEFYLTQNSQVGMSYLITIFVTVVGTALSLLINSMLAYAIFRRDFVLRRFITFFLFFTMLFNGGLVASYIINTKVLHLNNTIFILLVPGLCGAWNVILLKTLFTTAIGTALIESAKIDGAAEFRIYFQIVLPLAKAGLATIGFFTAVGYWNDWYTALLYIDNPNLYPLQYLLMNIQLNIEFVLSKMKFSTDVDFTMKTVLERMPLESGRMALAFIVMGPIIVVYPFFQRYFIKGIMVGSLKG